jgi:hypothetical protein
MFHAGICCVCVRVSTSFVVMILANLRRMLADQVRRVNEQLERAHDLF